jgi:hypothetical protein
MRVRKKLQTDNWGLLTIERRRADVGWFKQLPGVIAWLNAQRGPEVEVLHD